MARRWYSGSGYDDDGGGGGADVYITQKRNSFKSDVEVDIR